MVATGEAAIQEALRLRPDLILMDIRLAGAVDGIKAAEEIQSCLHIPVVYLTANADRATLERVKGSQPQGYILKPFNEAILSTTIEIALSRHQAETQVQEALIKAEVARQSMEEQIQLKSEYFSMASHEFRNPLATIQFATDYLHRYGDQLPPEKRQKHLERIRAATDSLNVLLEDVLTLSRVSSGRLQFEPRWMDVAVSCQELVDALNFSTEGQYAITFAAEGGDTTAILDEKLVWHLLNNLLSNAVKYSPLGASISLRLISSEDTLQFVVHNEGIGIPEEDVHSLFLPFHRASNVGKIPGTGLGLAIAKQCVDIHGGQITVASELGKGATFTVTLSRQLDTSKLACA